MFLKLAKHGTDQILQRLWFSFRIYCKKCCQSLSCIYKYIVGSSREKSWNSNRRCDLRKISSWELTIFSLNHLKPEVTEYDENGWMYVLLPEVGPHIKYKCSRIQRTEAEKCGEDKTSGPSEILKSFCFVPTFFHVPLSTHSSHWNGPNHPTPPRNGPKWPKPHQNIDPSPQLSCKIDPFPLS